MVVCIGTCSLSCDHRVTIRGADHLARLGHASASFTMDRYVHAIQEAEERAAQTVEGVELGQG
jgi:hypothetical protein